jgi:hypothetical protein
MLLADAIRLAEEKYGYPPSRRTPETQSQAVREGLRMSRRFQDMQRAKRDRIEQDTLRVVREHGPLTTPSVANHLQVCHSAAWQRLLQLAVQGSIRRVPGRPFNRPLWEAE